jgi:hypothetical protein
MREYVCRAREAGVQIMAGSGGHLPADKIGPFMRYQKELLQVPITCFGPQVTDISLGYDHVSAAMGQILALLAGADEIFSVTPAEHLGMPDEADQAGLHRRGAGLHSADLARGRLSWIMPFPGARGRILEGQPPSPDERVKAVLGGRRERRGLQRLRRCVRLSRHEPPVAEGGREVKAADDAVAAPVPAGAAARRGGARGQAAQDPEHVVVRGGSSGTAGASRS